MYEDVIDLLKAHDYFRGISGAVLGEIASLARRIRTLRRNLTAYDAACLAFAEALDAPLITRTRLSRESAEHRARVEVLR
jgi:predicted nucleic acid-binding protein